MPANLTRSGVVIIDNIIGSPRAVLKRFLAGTLSPARSWTEAGKRSQNT
jgi:hypothetical protein